MKIKFLILLAIGVFANQSVAAQEVDCARALSLFSQSAKVKDYKAAKPYYEKLIKSCQDYHISLYQYGDRMLKHFAKSTKDDAELQKQYAEQLIENYKLRLQNFPAKTSKGETYANIAEAMYDYKIGTAAEQLGWYEKAWKEDKENVNDPRTLYVYFNILVAEQDAGNRDLQEVFTMYDELIQKIEEQEIYRAGQAEPLLKKQELGESLSSKEERILKNTDIYLNNFNKIKQGINGLLGERADCDNLIPLYNKEFDAKKEDVEWLKRAAKRLSAKECTGDPLFFKLVESLHKQEPSAKSALYLGQLAAKDGKYSKALEYYEQSAELEDNKIDKARVYMMIAGNYKKSGSFSKARSYYKKALSIQPSLGSAYLQIASMYASSANNCGDTTFNKRAVYWLAAEYAERAARVSPAISSSAKQAAASYRGRAPQKSDVFQEGRKAGETIKIGCWIGESVRIPG
jgi:tetratricopeptide (TPR) repeat protein